MLLYRLSYSCIYVMYSLSFPSLSVYVGAFGVYALNGAFLMDALGRQVILPPNG